MKLTISIPDDVIERLARQLFHYDQWARYEVNHHAETGKWPSTKKTHAALRGAWEKKDKMIHKMWREIAQSTLTRILKHDPISTC